MTNDMIVISTLYLLALLPAGAAMSMAMGRFARSESSNRVLYAASALTSGMAILACLVQISAVWGLAGLVPRATATSFALCGLLSFGSVLLWLLIRAFCNASMRFAAHRDETLADADMSDKRLSDPDLPAGMAGAQTMVAGPQPAPVFTSRRTQPHRDSKATV